MAILKHRFLFEAEDDNQNQTTADNNADTAANAPAETETDGNQDNADNNETDQNNDTESEIDNSISDNPEDGQDEFSIDIDTNTDDNNDGAADNTAATSSTTGGDMESDEGSTEVDKDSAKTKDIEIYDSLTPAEQALKVKELKQLYLDIYSKCDNIIDKYNSLSAEYEDANAQFKRIIYILFDLKKMIYSYLMNVFDSKSYYENDIQYNSYLVILNSVKNITNQFTKVLNYG